MHKTATKNAREQATSSNFPPILRTHRALRDHSENMSEHIHYPRPFGYAKCNLSILVKLSPISF